MFNSHITQPLQFTSRGRWLATILLLILAMTTMMVARPFQMAGSLTAPNISASAISLDLARLPLSFVPNLGQADGSVHFQLHDQRSILSFKESEVLLELPGAAQAGQTTIRFQFENANTAAVVSGSERLTGVVNYLIGNHPSEWLTQIPTYASVTYRQLYPGVDLQYDGKSGNLKGTYTVAPGVDPSIIRWRHAGVAAVEVDQASGDLLITPATTGAKKSGPIVERAPVAWQNVAGRRASVDVRYAPAADGSVGFALGQFDSSLPLIIDPTLIYSTYLGGASFEGAEGIFVDGQGSVYVTGTTNSDDFPTKEALSGYGSGDDAYVFKINADGDALVYSTYLGGSGDDSGSDIALDGDGNVYVAGGTDSSNFPTMHPAQASCTQSFGGCTGDAFLVKLSAGGSSLLYGTYLGGSYPDEAEGLAVDSAGTAYLVGSTFSLNFPTKDAMQAGLLGATDSFVAKIDTTLAGTGSLVYSTYLGGRLSDYGVGIGVDATGDIYVVGHSLSSDFPTKDPLQAANKGANDLFVARLNAAGSHLVYSTYLGGSHNDYAYDMALDGSGYVYITGSTESPDFRNEHAMQTGIKGYTDAFVVKLNPDGAALTYSTYLGGSDYDYGYGIAVDGTGAAYVTGNTSSMNFPAKNSLQAYAGNGDAFVAKFASDGSQIYTSFLGGGDSDHGDSVAVDGDANAYIAGFTLSSDFPTHQPIQDAYAGNSDVFVAKINDVGDGVPLPPPEPGSDLVGSYKAASQQILAPGESLIYTIHLQNSGQTDATVDVSDPVPGELETIVDSISDGGTYDSGTKTISWSGVVVPAGSSVSLDFAVMPAVTVSEPIPVINTAQIMLDGKTLERMAGIVLLSEPVPGGTMAGSYKTASQHSLAPGESLVYTIRLYNNGQSPATVDVVDPVSDKLAVVESSISDGGVYDPETKTVSWSGIAVPSASGVSLTFEVEPAVEVVVPALVVNTATITFDGSSFERKSPVVLLPEPLSLDSVSPVVNRVTIGDLDVLSSPSVTLNISATDNVAVHWMYLREWHLATTPWPHWEVVQESGWVDYAETVPWTLSEVSGTHFIGVWVADDAHNRSHLDRQALDYASLLLPDTTIAQYGMVPYLVHYEEGVEVTGVLSPSQGDADLYLWYPGSVGIPDKWSTHPEEAVDSFTFTTPEAGAYLFLVHGSTEATYDLSITPGGGTPASMAVSASSLAGGLASEDMMAVKPGELIVEPVLSKTGLDPLGSTTSAAPSGPNVIFLPVIKR